MSNESSIDEDVGAESSGGASVGSASCGVDGVRTVDDRKRALSAARNAKSIAKKDHGIDSEQYKAAADWQQTVQESDEVVTVKVKMLRSVADTVTTLLEEANQGPEDLFVQAMDTGRAAGQVPVRLDVDGPKRRSLTLDMAGAKAVCDEGDIPCRTDEGDSFTVTSTKQKQFNELSNESQHDTARKLVTVFHVICTWVGVCMHDVIAVATKPLWWNKNTPLRVGVDDKGTIGAERAAAAKKEEEKEAAAEGRTKTMMARCWAMGQELMDLTTSVADGQIDGWMDPHGLSENDFDFDSGSLADHSRVMDDLFASEAGWGAFVTDDVSITNKQLTRFNKHCRKRHGKAFLRGKSSIGDVKRAMGKYFTESTRFSVKQHPSEKHPKADCHTARATALFVQLLQQLQKANDLPDYQMVDGKKVAHIIAKLAGDDCQCKKGKKDHLTWIGLVLLGKSKYKHSTRNLQPLGMCMGKECKELYDLIMNEEVVAELNEILDKGVEFDGVTYMLKRNRWVLSTDLHTYWVLTGQTGKDSKQFAKKKPCPGCHALGGDLHKLDEASCATCRQEFLTHYTDNFCDDDGAVLEKTFFGIRNVIYLPCCLHASMQITNRHLTVLARTCRDIGGEPMVKKLISEIRERCVPAFSLTWKGSVYKASGLQGQSCSNLIATMDEILPVVFNDRRFQAQNKKNGKPGVEQWSKDKGYNVLEETRLQWKVSMLSSPCQLTIAVALTVAVPLTPFSTSRCGDRWMQS
jgi:hypothetical protein